MVKLIGNLSCFKRRSYNETWTSLHTYLKTKKEQIVGTKSEAWMKCQNGVFLINKIRN